MWFYRKASEAGTVDVHDRMAPEDVPEEMREIRARMAHAERLTKRPQVIFNTGGDEHGA